MAAMVTPRAYMFSVNDCIIIPCNISVSSPGLKRRQTKAAMSLSQGLQVLQDYLLSLEQ